MLSVPVRAEASVMTSVLLPPVSVSTLATVAVLAKLPSVSESDPAPRSKEAFEAWVAMVMTSAF